MHAEGWTTAEGAADTPAGRASNPADRRRRRRGRRTCPGLGFSRVTTGENDMELLTFLVIGLVAALVSGHVLKTTGHGLPVDTVIGAFGAYAAVTLFALLGITIGGDIGPIVIGVVGAFVLPVVLKLLPRK